MYVTTDSKISTGLKWLLQKIGSNVSVNDTLAQNVNLNFAGTSKRSLEI